MNSVVKHAMKGVACMAVALFGAATAASALTQAELDTIGAAAEQAWIDTGLTADQIAALDSVTYSVADLGDDLGAVEGSFIVIDDDAAGDGWFIDPTPGDDVEFTLIPETYSVDTGAVTTNQYTDPDTGFVFDLEVPVLDQVATGRLLYNWAVEGTAAADGVDLLTVVLMELGHVLGLEHDESDYRGVMYGSVAVGERSLPYYGQANGAVPLSLTGVHYAHTTSRARVVWGVNGGVWNNPGTAWRDIDQHTGAQLPGWWSGNITENAIIQGATVANLNSSFTPEWHFNILIVRFGPTLNINNAGTVLDLQNATLQGDIADVPFQIGAFNNTTDTVNQNDGTTVRVGSITLGNNGGARTGSNFANYNLHGTLDASGGLTVRRSGSLRMYVDGNSASAITIDSFQAGSIQMVQASAAFPRSFLSGPITLTQNADFRGAGNEFSGGITSAGNQNLSMNGKAWIEDNPIDLNAGIMTFTSNGNNPANATELNVAGNDWNFMRLNFDGYLKLGAANALPSDAHIRFGWHVVGSSRGTLDLNGFDQTVAALRFAPEGGGTWRYPTADRTVTSTGGDATLTINLTSGTQDYPGNIEGSLSIVKTGGGHQILDSTGTAANNYSGDTTVQGGTLEFRAANLADGADVYLNSGSSLFLNFVGSDTVNRLFINGVEQCPGLYGSAQTGLISGSGQLQVLSDTTPPVITCPQNYSLPADANCEALITDLTLLTGFSVSDACDNNPTVTQSPAAGSAAMGIGTHPVTITATDASGNSANCVVIVTVEDQTAPVITCPANETVDCDAIPAPPATTPASDNCDTGVTSASLSNTDDQTTQCGGGTITHTYSVTDASANSASCDYVITVNPDTTAPAIDPAPASIMIECDGDIPAPAVVGATDNCDGALVATLDESDNGGTACVSDPFIITRTWTATDSCGNASASVTQTITVQDTIAPVLTGVPADATVECDAVPTAPTVTADDNCDGSVAVTPGESTAAGACANESIITRTWSATDSCGNVVNASQTITVVDTTDPVITCPADVTVECDEAVAPSGRFIRIENNGPDNRRLHISEIEVFAPGIAAVANTSLDSANDLALISNGASVESSSVGTPGHGIPDATIDGVEQTGGATWTRTEVGAYIVIDLGETYEIERVRVHERNDGCCQDRLMDFSVSVLADAAGSPGAVVSSGSFPGQPPSNGSGEVVFSLTGTATATDNCDPAPVVTFSDSTAAGACPQSSTITRTWTATDACGNISTCDQIITVQDTTGPVITCAEDTTIECSDPILAGCAGQVVRLSIPPGTIINIGEVEVFADGVNVALSGTASQDSTLVCCGRPFDASNAIDGNTGGNWRGGDEIAHTASGGGAWWEVDLGGTFEIDQIVIWNRTDCCQSRINNYTIEVLDAPGGNVVWSQGPNPWFPVSATHFVSAAVYDNCDPNPTLTSSDVVTQGSCPSESTITRTWTATDACGNQTVHVQTISIVDTTAPTIHCPMDVTVECGDATDPATIAGPLAGLEPPADITANVPEAATYSLIYELNIPDLANFRGANAIPYSIDNAAALHCPFTRVAYYLELDGEWVWVSMDTFTTDASEIGLPHNVDNPVVHQQRVNNMNVAASAGAGVATGNGFSSGNIEMWPANYNGNNALGIPGAANHPIFDWGDTSGGAGAGYGSFQVHNHGTPEVVFAYNAWGSGNTDEVGIGSQSINNPDWTFADNAATYTTKRLRVLVQASPSGAACASDNCTSCTPVSIGAGASIDGTLLDGGGARNNIDKNNVVTLSAATYQVNGFNFKASQNGSGYLVPFLAIETAPDTYETIWVGDTVIPAVNGEGTENYTVGDTFTLTAETDVYAGAWHDGGSRVYFANGVPSTAHDNSGVVLPTDVGQSLGTISHPDLNRTYDFSVNISACVVTYSDSVAGSCPEVITRTWTASDACGNSSSCDQVITVEDTTPPTITAAADITVECTESTLPPCFGQTVRISLPTSFLHMQEVEVYSGGVNVALGKPASQSSTLRNSGNWAAHNGNDGVFGNAGGQMQHTWNNSGDDWWEVDLGADYPIDEIKLFNRTNRGVNRLNNYSVEVYDSGGTLVWESTGNPTPVGGVASHAPFCATFSDICDATPTLSYVDSVAPGSCPQESVITRTFTATDACGNSASDVQVITVVDTTAPTITLPADVTVECSGDTSPAATGSATGADNCGAVTVSSSDSSVAGCGNSETITRTWTATDACGNSTSGDQVITVVDTTAPVLDAAPAAVTVECEADVAATASDLGYTDNCDAAGTVSPVDGPLVGGACGGTITRTWDVSDACGNAAVQRVQVITVQDTTAPSITAPADVTIECTADESSASNGVATGSDNCGSVTITESDAVVDQCGNSKTITRTWTATDDCGNATSADQVITVVDTTAPSITVPADTTVECTGDTSPASNGSATGSDTCGSVTITSSDASVAGCGNTETITRTWTATDECGNSTSGEQVITVVDTTVPSLTVPADATVECTGDTSPASNGSATGSDTCGSVTITSSDASVAGCGNTETITRTWTATDECGNSTSGDQVITVVDTTAPSLTVPADTTVECTGDTSPASNGSATGSDTCGTVTITSSDSSVAGCGATETITRTWTATDECGNSTSGDQVITVVDTTAPSISVPADVTLECPADTSPAANGTATGSDTCGSVTITSSDVSVAGCGNTETITRTWTATDECGNSTSADQVIAVVDTTVPVITAPADSLLGCGDAYDPALGASASDSCEGDLTGSLVIGNPVNTGSPGCYTVTYDVSDSCGNAAAQQSSDVIVSYNIEGLLAPLDDQTVTVLASMASNGDSLNLDCSGLKSIKAKRGGLPLKIRLTDCGGATQTDGLLGGAEPKVTRILTLGGPDGLEVIDLVDPESTGNSNLPDGTMRISDDKWIYTLDVDDTGVDGLDAGCYAAEFTVTLPGGCTVYAYAAFKLK